MSALSDNQNQQTVSAILSWSHFERLMRIENPKAREWYLKEASEQMWSFRTLNRNINTQYYERLLLTQADKRNVKNESIQSDKLEFLGLPNNISHIELDIEKAIITHIRDFIMEMGKGFAFVARQQLIRTEAEDYYIDLVFYNYILKCFVLIDLKASKITHQDVGQMDMYIRMYDELKRSEGDSPTIGIVLCSQTDVDIARYSILKGNEQLFASKYKLFLPTEDELKHEIEKQREILAIQQSTQGESNTEHSKM